MHRTEGDGHVSNLFDPGDPFIPQPATQLTHDWCNAVQEELALTIEGLGGTLATASTDTTPNQLLTQLNAKYGRLDLVNTWAALNTFNAGVTLGAGSNLSVGGTLSVTGNTSLGGSLSVTASTTLTGPATLNGATAVNAALTVTPAGNTTAVTGNGSGTGGGASFLGGATNGRGARAQGVGTGEGLLAFGGVNGPGLIATPGAAATGATRKTAISVDNGDIVFTDGTAAPSTTTVVKNTITPVNFPKAMALFTTGASTVTPADGFNVASVTVFDSTGASALGDWRVRITFAAPMASPSYGVTVQATDGNNVKIRARTATYVEISLYNPTAMTTPVNVLSTGYEIYVEATGRQ
jgi:hypothetical protein